MTTYFNCKDNTLTSFEYEVINCNELTVKMTVSDFNWNTIYSKEQTVSSMHELLSFIHSLMTDSDSDYALEQVYNFWKLAKFYIVEFSDEYTSESALIFAGTAEEKLEKQLNFWTISNKRLCEDDDIIDNIDFSSFEWGTSKEISFSRMLEYVNHRFA